MAVIRANASYTEGETNIKHAVLFIERGPVSSGLAANCSQQCKALEAMQNIGNNVPKTPSLLYFACSDGDNSNGDNATIYKSRTEKFNCDNCMFMIVNS